MTGAMNAALIDSVQQRSPRAEATLRSAAGSDARYLKETPAWRDLRGEVYAAAVGFQFGLVPRSIPNLAVCDGCRLALPKEEWLHHVSGCTRREGINDKKVE